MGVYEVHHAVLVMSALIKFPIVVYSILEYFVSFGTLMYKVHCIYQTCFCLLACFAVVAVGLRLFEVPFGIFPFAMLIFILLFVSLFEVKKIIMLDWKAADLLNTMELQIAWFSFCLHNLESIDAFDWDDLLVKS